MRKNNAVLVKGFILFLLLLSLGIAITVYVQARTSVPAKAAAGTSPASPVVPTATSRTTTSADVHSSKADRKLTLVTTSEPDGTTSYDFSVSDLSGGNTIPIVSRTFGPGSSMSLPFNAWDPTDTYIFVEQKTGSTLHFYVYKSNGETFANGDKFIDVASVWTEKKIGYTIRDATGWASGTLLIIYTTKDDGTHGPAFWFEIPSTAIIQLAG